MSFLENNRELIGSNLTSRIKFVNTGSGEGEEEKYSLSASVSLSKHSRKSNEESSGT